MTEQEKFDYLRKLGVPEDKIALLVESSNANVKPTYQHWCQSDEEHTESIKRLKECAEKIRYCLKPFD